MRHVARQKDDVARLVGLHLFLLSDQDLHAAGCELHEDEIVGMRVHRLPRAGGECDAGCARLGIIDDRSARDTNGRVRRRLRGARLSIGLQRNRDDVERHGTGVGRSMRHLGGDELDVPHVALRRLAARADAHLDFARIELDDDRRERRRGEFLARAGRHAEARHHDACVVGELRARDAGRHRLGRGGEDRDEQEDGSTSKHAPSIRW
jgi:hypothetical protein